MYQFKGNPSRFLFVQNRNRLGSDSLPSVMNGYWVMILLSKIVLFNLTLRPKSSVPVHIN